jgi:hypothetical protein
MPGHAGHREVHQRDVALKLERGVHAGGSVTRDAADFDVLDRGEQGSSCLGEDGVVVDDQDADHATGRPVGQFPDPRSASS